MLLAFDAAYKDSTLTTAEQAKVTELVVTESAEAIASFVLLAFLQRNPDSSCPRRENTMPETNCTLGLEIPRASAVTLLEYTTSYLTAGFLARPRAVCVCSGRNPTEGNLCIWRGPSGFRGTVAKRGGT